VVISPGDRFLIMASDGVFEVLRMPELCAHAHAVATGRGHPALSSPRAPAIPLLATKPISLLERLRARCWHILHDLVRHLIKDVHSSVLQALTRWPLSVLFGRNMKFGRPDNQFGENVELLGCCDCSYSQRSEAAAAHSCDRDESQSHQSTRTRGRASAPFTHTSKFLRPETLSSAIAYRIAQEAFNRGSMDNIAVIVVDLATDENKPVYQPSPVGEVSKVGERI